MKIAVICWDDGVHNFEEEGRDRLEVVGDAEVSSPSRRIQARSPLPSRPQPVGHYRPAPASFLYGGPSLPLQYSRVSPDDSRLSVVIDPEASETCSTLFATHVEINLDKAIRNLKRRKMCLTSQNKPETLFQKHAVGYVNVKTGKTRCSGGQQIAATISSWCQDSEFDAAIWWDAPPNFETMKGEPFTLDGALAHIDNLEGNIKSKLVWEMTRAPVDLELNSRVSVANPHSTIRPLVRGEALCE